MEPCPGRVLLGDEDGDDEVAADDDPVTAPDVAADEPPEVAATAIPAPAPNPATATAPPIASRRINPADALWGMSTSCPYCRRTAFRPAFG